jgi:hypothetical protein
MRSRQSGAKGGVAAAADAWAGFLGASQHGNEADVETAPSAGWRKHLDAIAADLEAVGYRVCGDDGLWYMSEHGRLPPQTCIDFRDASQPHGRLTS